MSITATVQNGVVRLPEEVHLPDGTRVVVDIIERRDAVSSGSLADCLSRFAGIADDLPSDLARRMCGLAERLGDSSTFLTPGELHSLRSDRTSA
jgi:predicted DNA-binding antitoxin AbrB/MazE fold protein